MGVRIGASSRWGAGLSAFGAGEWKSPRLMAGVRVEQQVVKQVPASPGPPRVADGGRKDGQHMTGCSKDHTDIPTTAGRASVWSGGC